MNIYACVHTTKDNKKEREKRRGTGREVKREPEGKTETEW